MRTKIMILVSLIFMTVAASNAMAQQPQQNVVIYPAKGQNQQQMEMDKYECYTWAKQQTGFDPMAMPTATSAPPPSAQGSPAGGAVKGGAGGALVGLAIGSLSGSAGEGAAIGAVAGGIFGGLRARHQQEEAQEQQQQWANQQASQYMQKRDYYNRAYSACLTGRGYVVQ
jgi:hypothetical protein